MQCQFTKVRNSFLNSRAVSYAHLADGEFDLHTVPPRKLNLGFHCLRDWKATAEMLTETKEIIFWLLSFEEFRA